MGVGASAGGLEAFTRLLTALPPQTGMAFVLVQHLDLKHESMLARLLSHSTTMPVHEARDGMRLEMDHVYVIPPNKMLAVLHRRLSLMARSDSRGQNLPVDFSFYKPTTIKRRITRRMQSLKRVSLSDYAEFLRRLEQVLGTGSPFEGLEIVNGLLGASGKRLQVSASAVLDEENHGKWILVGFEPCPP